MTGRHAASRVRIEHAQHPRGWRVKFPAYDQPASAWNVYPTWPAALRRAQRGGGRFVPVGWRFVWRSAYGDGDPAWVFVWRCLACGRHVGIPAIHKCMPVIATVPEDYRPRRPGRRYDWTSHIGLG